MNLDLLTNATAVDVRFVSFQKHKESLKASANDGKQDKEESNEPDYDEDKDQLEKNRKRKPVR